MSNFYQFTGFKEGDLVTITRGEAVSVIRLNFILDGSENEDDRYAQVNVQWIGGAEYPHSLLESGPDAMQKFTFDEITLVA